MIRSIEIKNFRGFKSLAIPNCQPINIIVGDSGTGKTALLEAIFLALSGNISVAPRFRAQRGLEGGVFQGDARQIEHALFEDLFNQLDDSNPIEIRLNGDGADNRSVSVNFGTYNETIPFDGQSPPTLSGGIQFVWTNSSGRAFSASPTITPDGIRFPHQQESLPDYFYHPASITVPSTENASRFSELSKKNLHLDFVRIFTEQYEWIEDLSIEIAGGVPLIHASIRGINEKIPVSLASGAVNRVISILLGPATRKHHVLLVDEIENGIYHKRHGAFWKGLSNLVRRQSGQMFVTTHSDEWLNAIVEDSAAKLDDVSLWRVVRSSNGPQVRQYSGKSLRAGVQFGQEVR